MKNLKKVIQVIKNYLNSQNDKVIHKIVKKRQKLEILTNF